MPAAQTDTSSQAATQSSDQNGMTATDTKVNINKASVKELMKIKGINASKAKAIVAYRKKHGNFKSLDDLSKVKGFTKMKASSMKTMQDQLSVE